MKNEEDKKIDDLFRKRLENPDQPSGYREEDWDAMENMLGQHKIIKRGVYLWPILSSVAAIMLIFIGWWLFRLKESHANDQHQPQLVKVIGPTTGKRTTASGTSQKNEQKMIAIPLLQQPPAYIAKTADSKNINKTNIKRDPLNNNTDILTSAPVNKSRDSVFENTFAKSHPLYKALILNSPPAINKWNVKKPLADLNYIGGLVSKNSVGPISLSNQNKQNDIAAISTPRPDFNLTVSTSNVPAQKIPAASSTEQPMTAAEKSNAAFMKLLARTIAPVNLSAKTQPSFKPHFTGGIIGGQDINGAGSFKQGKLGSKAGLIFAAGISQKFTISTGAVYSSTPYDAGSESFNLPYQYKVPPVSLSANCQMIDIPVNVGYQVYNNGKNTISLGTGLSSYIMLQQDYNFVYSNSSGVTSKYYSVPNSSSYLFKIVNFNATYQRKITSKAGITVQPYLKLPLADIGYSQVKLQSAGVAVGLIWSLGSSQP